MGDVQAQVSPGPPPLDGQPGVRRARRVREPLQVGEPIVIGREPTDPVIITVQCGSSIRQIKTWMVSMSDAVDHITGALRHAVAAQEQAGKARR